MVEAERPPLQETIEALLARLGGRGKLIAESTLVERASKRLDQSVPREAVAALVETYAAQGKLRVARTATGELQITGIDRAFLQELQQRAARTPRP